MKKGLYLSLFLATVTAHAGTIYPVGPQGYVNTDTIHYTTGIPQYRAPFSHVKPHLISQTYHNPFSKQ